MADPVHQPTHEINYIVLEKDQHFLILKALKEGVDEVVVSIDEILASHLIGVQGVEVKPRLGGGVERKKKSGGNEKS